MTYFGLLNLDKPAGLTSRDAVNHVQRLVRPEKVGHAGTLDPLATGVLVIALGRATRLIEYVQRLPKSYEGTFRLGATSPTEDIEGEITYLESPPIPTLAQIGQAAASLTGLILQRPPAFSALKVAGRRAHELARGGEDVQLEPRPVRIDRIEVLDYEYPNLQLAVDCGSGTYIRSLGRDLGVALGSGAVMTSLRRTAIGPFLAERSVQLEEVTTQRLPDLLVKPDGAVLGLPTVELTDEQLQRLRHGEPLRLDNSQLQTVAYAEPQELVAVDAQEDMVAVLRPTHEGTWRTARNFVGAG